MRFCLVTVMKHTQYNQGKRLFLGLYIEGLAFLVFKLVIKTMDPEQKYMGLTTQVLSAKQNETYSSNPKAKKTENEL